jgi:DNA mismatch repair protein MutL
MPERITLLDEHTINQIAAGEVVERPASVVKELVENALDAGAQRIEIEVTDAGRRLIRVADDGIGMSPEDARRSLERHATSKIKTPSDLQGIQTLGFRGEALPSIASVSQMTLSTSEEDGSRTVLVVAFGEIVENKSSPGPRGTEIRVERLFENTPARLKFLKTDSSEIGNIVDILEKYVVAFPFVSFKLSVDGDIKIHSTGRGQPREAIAEIWGSELVRSLAEVSTSISGIMVTGFTAPPHINRATRKQQFLFVNNRPIRSKALFAAIDAAYRSLTPEKRYPVVVLHLQVPPSQIDINVSPTKTELKFAKEGAVFDAVRLALKSGLMENGMMPSVASGLSETININSVATDLDHNKDMYSSLSQTAVVDLFRQDLPAEQNTRYPFAELVDGLKVLGQIGETFIVASNSRGLTIIDQHVAHERVLYEILCGLRSETPVEKQALLSPETIEFDRSVAIALSDKLPELRNLGFDIDRFGNNSYIVRSLPAAITARDWKHLLYDLASEICEFDGRVQTQEARHRIWITTACHMAVKAGDVLSIAEMEKLIKDLAETENPYMCPHGRPIAITLTFEELLRRFKRV